MLGLLGEEVELVEEMDVYKTNDDDVFIKQFFAARNGESYHQLRNRLCEILIEEGRILKHSEMQWQEEIRECLMFLLQKYGNSDGYLTSVYTGQILRTGVKAFQPSPNAVKSVFFRSKDNQFRYHTAGNIVPVELCLDYVKFEYPAGILQILRNYLRLREREPRANSDLMRAMDEIHVVKEKTPYRRVMQIGVKTPKRKWKTIDHEQLTCKVSSTNGGTFEQQSAKAPWRWRMKRDKAPKRNWTPTDFDRLQGVLDDIRTRYPQQYTAMPEGQAGFPYPFFPSTMPAVWSWWTAWRMFGERVMCMYLDCNGKWDHVNGTETIFLEAIIQCVLGDDNDNDNKSRPRLYLPMSVYTRRPLRFAVAHHHHGEQLRSGWVKAEPTSFPADYDATLNNMLFESSIENYVKSEFDEDTVPAVFERIRQVDLSMEYYNPDHILQLDSDDEDEDGENEPIWNMEQELDESEDEDEDKV